MSRSVICISRTDGARGDEVGRLVAERFGFDLVDEEIVAQAATRGGVSSADVADEEQRKSTLGRFFREIGRSGHGPAGDRLGISGMALETRATSEEIRGLIQATIEETAGHGDVVIVAHAASFTLAGSPEVLRVFVTAPPEARAQTLSETRGLDAAAALKAIEQADAARADYLKRFHGVHTERAEHYDLVVNTGSLDPQRAAELVALAAR